MGVPGLYSFLAKNYPECIRKYENSKSVIYNEYEIDTLLIDGNACLHPICRQYYFAPPPKMRLTGKSINTNIKTNMKTDIECYRKIGEHIEELYLRVKPKTFYYAIDGVVNRSKTFEQRKRRFLSLSNDNQPFNSTNISVGTPWMQKLHKYLLRFFINLGFKYKNTKFIYDSYLNVGEGEHRLIEYIRKCENENEKCAIHANDADCIPLSLGTHRKHCYILRDRVDDYNDQCSVIDIYKLRQSLINSYLPYVNISDFDKINSIIFVWYFVGMDFLPRCPSLEIFNNGMEDIAFFLHKSMVKYGSIVTFENDDVKNGFKINTKALVYWMREISKRDITILQRKATDQNYISDPIIVRNCISDTNNIIVNEIGYKKDYNCTHFKNDEGLKNACKEFVNGLFWTFEYYTSKSPSWDWYYPYHYSPYINDIANYIESSDFSIPKFTLGEPVPEFLQLLYTLPPKAFHLLPKPLHILKDKYKEMFPSELIIDKTGIKASCEWEQKILLPFIDFDLLKKEYFKLYPYTHSRNCATRIVQVIDN